MNPTVIDLATVPPIGRDEARELAETEYRRIIDAFAALAPSDWDRPTDCELWSVRDLAGHVVGAMRSAASVRHQVGEMRAVKRRTRELGGPEVDHMTAIQIEGTADLSPADLVAEGRELVVPAAAGRRRVPAPVRKLAKIPVDVPGLSETWTLGYLLDTILTRDIWMHRVDLSRATDRPMDLDEVHDARIVADVAREWAERHGRPVELRLIGDAGGTYVSASPEGDEPEQLELDAVEFCRIVSRRAPGEGLLDQAVPF